LLTGLTDGPAGSLLEPADSLSTRLPETLPEPAEPLANASERLPCSTTKLPDRSTGPQRLSCRVGQSAECLAGRPSRLYRLPRRLSDVVERLTDCPAGPKRLLSELPDAADRVVYGLDEALQNLRVAVEGGQRPIEDVVQVLKPHLQLRFGLYALDVDLDLA
jgi:hypothetical protein